VKKEICAKKEQKENKKGGKEVKLQSLFTSQKKAVKFLEDFAK